MSERRVLELLDRGQKAANEAKRLSDPALPTLVRLWHHRRCMLLLQEAETLLEEVSRLVGEPIPETKRPWYWPTRRVMLVLQYATGICNAYSCISFFSDGYYLAAAFSVLCLFITTQWVIPRK